MRVAFTAVAENDLMEISDYVRSERGPGTADKLLDNLMNACAVLAHMPQRYPILDRYADKGYRRKIWGPYLIFFRLGKDRMEIVRIIHGARDVTRLLG